MGDLYVAPIQGQNVLAAAKKAGLHEVPEPIVMRVEATTRPG